MLARLLISWVVTSICVVVHAVGTTAAVRWLTPRLALLSRGYLHPTWLLIRIAGWLITMHVLDISLWGLFYRWGHAFSDFHSALYFSSVTYTTVGYGDLVLPREFRLVGGIEALIGILMCGWSSAFFFAVVLRMHEAREAASSGAGRDGTPTDPD